MQPAAGIQKKRKSRAKNMFYNFETNALYFSPHSQYTQYR